MGEDPTRLGKERRETLLRSAPPNRLTEELDGGSRGHCVKTALAEGQWLRDIDLHDLRATPARDAEHLNGKIDAYATNAATFGKWTHGEARAAAKIEYEWRAANRVDASELEAAQRERPLRYHKVSVITFRSPLVVILVNARGVGFEARLIFHWSTA